MTTNAQQSPLPPISDRLIRDLITEYPDVLTVLAPYGIDLCCGGNHPLGEALDLHGVPREPVLANVAQVIARQTGGS